MSQRTTLISLVLVAVSARASAEVPRPVSPRVAGAIAVVRETCPTFNWTASDGASAIELVVFRLAEGEAEGPPVKVVGLTLPGTATGWTATLGGCLERGEHYAWSVGSEGRWSEAALFEIAPWHWPLDSVQLLEELSRLPDAGPVPVSPAELTVQGEVRTVDGSGDPRVWGRGRSGVTVYPQVITGNFCSNGLSNKFGLTSLAVDWGSAADVCPVGTWVCRFDDLTACNTTRPDTSFDSLQCDGGLVDHPEDQHLGWTEQAAQSLIAGLAFHETGGGGIQVASCSSLPVWCCWD